MKRHAAVPQHEYLKGVRQIEGQVVKEDITQTGAGEQPQNEVEVDIVDLRPSDPCNRIPELIKHQEIGRGEAQDVHHTVPAHGERTDAEDLGVYMRVRYHRRSTSSALHRSSASLKTSPCMPMPLARSTYSSTSSI